MTEATIGELKQLHLFEGIPEEEVQWVLDHSRIERLENGDYFHKENQPVEKFYIVLEGELQVTRRLEGQEIVVGTTPLGIMGGELALLNGTVSQVTSRAIQPSTLLVLDKPAFRELFSTCPAISARIFQTAAQRTQGFASYQTQREKLAALGKLSAGLAHELNNPATAVRRAAQSLSKTLPELHHETMRLCSLGLSDEQLDYIFSFQQNAIPNSAAVKLLLPLEQSEREEEIGAWLETHEIDSPWDKAANFVSTGVSLKELQELAGDFASESLVIILNWLDRALCTRGLLEEIGLSTNRISELVSAVKSYTFMDQAPVQEVDIHTGLENTLTIMSYKLKKIDVIRLYDSNLPRIMGRGGELNQVWTNLIDNAIDAMQGEGELRLITRCENDFVMVEIADNGPGIPAEAQAHLFEPFYTTKGVGVGAGLGLDISYRIIRQHNGSIEVQSEPGLTRFIVRLPVRGMKMDE